MAHVLITHPSHIDIYTPIASIRKYTEPNFEDKLWHHAKSIFKNYHVFKFKYPLTCDAIPGKSFEPDLLLVSKTFKKWVIIEVELCKPPTVHTSNQITCFSNPKINGQKAQEIVDFLIRNGEVDKAASKLYLDCFTNYSPGFIVVLDDYSDSVFSKFYSLKKELKICVLEVYKKAGYVHEGYRFGGDYPYELTNSSTLNHVDNQHYQIVRTDFLKDLPGAFEVKFNMIPLEASLIKISKSKTYLKLADHNIPADRYMQIGKTVDDEYIIQPL